MAAIYHAVSHANAACLPVATVHHVVCHANAAYLPNASLDCSSEPPHLGQRKSPLDARVGDLLPTVSVLRCASPRLAAIPFLLSGSFL